MFTLAGKGTDGGIGEALPAMSLMRGGLSATHGEGGVQQQHALCRPAREVARGGRHSAQLLLDLGVDIAERWRQLHTLGDGEGEAHSLSGLMVWVLSQDDHLHTVEGCGVEGIENLGARGIARACGIFLSHESRQLLEVRLLKLCGQLPPPRFLDFYHSPILNFQFSILNCPPWGTTGGLNSYSPPSGTSGSSGCVRRTMSGPCRWRAIS